MDGKRGAGEGYGVHICTGPVAIGGAEPGDIRSSDHGRKAAAVRQSGIRWQIIRQ
jgi:hypothetical protein